MIKRQRSKSLKVRSLACVAVAVLFLAACGGSDDSEDTTSSPATETPTAEASPDEPAEPADDQLAQVKSDVATFLAREVELPAPVDPVDPGEHQVAIIATGMASSGPATVAAALVDAVETIGWTSPDPYDGQFTPTEQATGISQAVADGAEVIFLVAISPSAVSAAIAEAQAAAIPIVCILCGPDPITDGIWNVEADSDSAGYAQAAYVTAMSEGAGTIVLYQNEEFKFSTEQGAATEKYLGEICPGCTVDVRSALFGESREPNAPIHTSLLQEYGEGELDFVIYPFDSPAGALSTTASQLGRTDFGVVGYGALSPFVDMVGVGEPVVAKASVTISSPYYGWAAVDIAARVLAGADIWEADSMPVALITMDNFDTYPTGLPYLYPDFEFVEYFGGLWGK